MRDADGPAVESNGRVGGSDSRVVHVGLTSELTPWQRRELNQLLIELPSLSADLPAMLRRSVAGVCEAMGWNAGLARWDDGADRGTHWHQPEPDRFDLEALRAALERAPVVGPSTSDAESLVRLDPLVALGETRAREAARDAGLAGYGMVSVRAAGRLVAMIELFSETAPPRLAGLNRPTEIRDVLEVLASTLGLAATGTRMRAAVRQAAEHARRTRTELEEARAHRSSASAGGLYDTRSGLPTGPLLLDRIRQAIRRRQRSPRDQFAVLVVDVQGLDTALERFGEESVADVLVAAGRRLSGHTRPADTTAVLETGRFVLVVEGIRTVDEALGIARRAEKEIRRPFPSARSDVRLDVHIGVALGGPAYDRPDTLIADAAAAASRGADGEGRVHVFDRATEVNRAERERLREHLATALERREFFLEYQPIVSLRDGRITGLETFLRWKHPELGLVPPDRFIPAAAESALIHDLGAWVLEQVCEQIGRWRGRASLRVPPIGINVLGRQLYHEAFLDRVRDTLERHGIQGHEIRFDVGEADLMRDAEKASAVLDRLQGMGIDVAIDDFGTGYSSLSLLHDLPVRALKIDRSFVSDRREKLREWSVARTIVELAKILEIDVIAEGIETREQFLALRQAGCTQAQGYHFSGPVGAARAETLVREGYPLDLEAARR